MTMRISWQMSEMLGLGCVRVHRCRLKHAVYRYHSVDAKPFHDIPSPTSLPLVGTLFSLILAGGASKLHLYIDKRHRQFGPILREKIGPMSSVFLNDAKEIRKVFMHEGRYPKHVLPECWLLYNKEKNYKRGLLFMDGEEWLESRKFLNDVLLKRDYCTKAARNVAFVEDVVARWLQCSDDGQIINLEDELYHLSLIFMMSFVFGSHFHENANVFIPRIRQLSGIVKLIFQCSVKLSVVPAALAMRLNLKIWTDFASAVDESIRITNELVHDVISTRWSKNDVSAEDGDKGVLHHLLDLKLDTKLIERIVVDLILAAGDTNAYTTLWTFYLLGRHKDVQRALLVDMKRSGTGAGSAGTDASHAGVGNENDQSTLSIWNVIRESMRLYPIAPFIARYLPEETSICSYRVPPHQLISLSMYSCSRNDQYFPNADQFQPSRWRRLANGKYVGVTEPYATLPFAAGSRSCIGRNLSKAQLLLTINKVVSAYEIESLNEVDIKLNLITVPSGPVHLRLKKR